MKKILFLLVAAFLIPSASHAIELTSAECAQLNDIPALATADITARAQANGYTGCSGFLTLQEGDKDHIIGFGAEVASESGVFEVFRDTAKTNDASFLQLFCPSGSVTECSEQFIDIEDNYTRVIDWHNTVRDEYGKNATVVETYGSYVISLKLSESNPFGRVAHPGLHDDVLAALHSILDARSTPIEVTHTDVVSHEATVEVVSVSGDVEVIKSDGTTHVLKSGDSISASDQIYTNLDSSARLRFADGHQAQVHELSDVTVALLSGDADALQTRLELAAGNMSVEVGLSSTVKSDFTIKTPTATCSVRGTTFLVDYDKDTQETTLQVQEGSVEISTDSGSELVEGGNQATAGADGSIALSAFDGEIQVGGNGSSGAMVLVVAVVVILLVIGGAKMKK